MRVILHGRRKCLVMLQGNLCWSAHVNDVSHVTRINNRSDFVWQAQYLVKSEDDC